MLEQLKNETKIDQPLDSDWSKTLKDMPIGDTAKEKAVKMYCDTFRMMWTISTQLNMEVYGASQGSVDNKMLTKSLAKLVTSALVDFGFNKFICFEQEDWTDFLYEAFEK